jgi:hypothetical protein
MGRTGLLRGRTFIVVAMPSTVRHAAEEEVAEGLGPGGFKEDGWGIRPSNGCCLTSRNRGPAVDVTSCRCMQGDGKLRQVAE